MHILRSTICAALFGVLFVPGSSFALTQTSYYHFHSGLNDVYNDAIGRTFQDGTGFAEQARFGSISPDPCLWTVGCHSPNPAVGAHLAVPVGGIGDLAEASLAYSFVASGSGPLSTINVIGQYELMVGNVASVNGKNQEQASFYFLISEFADFSSPTIAFASGCQNYGSNSYAGCTMNGPVSFTQQVHTGETMYLKIVTNISLDAYGDAALSGDVFVDPYIRIDPNFAATHPGYSIQVADGVSNFAPPVPEPSEAFLLTVGGVLLGTVVRRRRSIHRKPLHSDGLLN